MLPFAVVLGTGVATAYPDETARIPATPPLTAGWLPQKPLSGRSPVGIAVPFGTQRGDRAVGRGNPFAADSWSRAQAVDAPQAPPAVDQEPIQAFCAHIPVDPGRCTATAVDAGLGAAIGAGVAAGASAPVAITIGLVGAAAGFVAGIPFLPTGLVAGPLLGAAVGVAVVAVPAAILGGALGAAVGAIMGITTPGPQADGRTDGSGAPTTSPS
ncbi:hypothetical protein ACW2Q0_09010 [Nocardia sp. R16R-3T]